MKYNSIQLFGLNGHYLIVGIYENLYGADIWTYIAFYCILGHQTVWNVMLQMYSFGSNSIIRASTSLLYFAPFALILLSLWF